MIMAHLESFGNLLVIPTKVFPDSLVNRLQGFEAISFLRSMETGAFEGAVVDADEDKL